MTLNENGKVVIYAPNSNEPIERFPVDATDLINEHGYTLEPVEAVDAKKAK